MFMFDDEQPQNPAAMAIDRYRIIVLSFLIQSVFLL